tara:strand:+ start:422 stop:889 length:468 start_codon:yes stop_codon:yes gene_type:complete
MATTITPATLTVKITEEITLNGQQKGSTNTLRIDSVVEVSQRIVNVGTTELIVLALGTEVAAGQFKEADVRYIRITNLDDTNHVVLVFRSENSNECAHKVDAGHSFILAADNSGGLVDVHDASATALTVSLDDLVDITAQADTAAVDLELFVAGV